MSSAAELARRIAEMDAKVTALSRASQISHSTVPVDGEDMAVPDAIGHGIQAGADVADVRDVLDQTRLDLEIAQAELGEKLAHAELTLGDAESRLDDAETQITDAFGQIGTVQSVADAAHTLAGTAEEHAQTAITSASAAEAAAASAQSTADNLPKVLHGTVEATGTAPNGSIWYQHAESLSGNVIGQWNRVADSWVSTPISSEAIANLDVGKLTAGAAAIAELVAQKIAAASGQFLELDVGQLAASSAVIAEAVIEKLFADVVVARMSVAEEFIGENAILTGAVTAPKVAAETLNVSHLEPNIGSSIDIRINPAVAGVQDGLDEQRRNFRFDEDGLAIGDPETQEELRMTPGRVALRQGGRDVSWWEAQQFYVERMVVEAANIGEHRWESTGPGETTIRPL